MKSRGSFSPRYSTQKESPLTSPPSLKKISLRLPELMLEKLKALANKHNVPYQSLMKMFLAERIEHELKSASR